ncbi:MAG: hypothetical protein N2Z81_07330 [Hydrogenothermaceae bacterium]|nr:hypothetical protein [Hydrogenothermaceae bacterium]
MKFEEAKTLLCESLKHIEKNLYWLSKSYEKVKDIDLTYLDEDNFEIIEVMLSRFSRTVDLLINRILRTLDIVELEDVTKKLDTVIRAEKRGFVDDYRELIELKDLRNELSHEYIADELVEKVKEVIEKTPNLIGIVKKVIEYVDKMNYCKEEL